MKTFLRKHKTILIALAGVLCIGIVTGLLIGGSIRLSMTERSFTTVAEANEPTEAPQTEEPVSEPTAAAEESANVQPTPTPYGQGTLKMSAEEVRRINETVQFRRRYIIPIRSWFANSENTFMWTEEKPDSSQVTEAREAADRYATILFGKSFWALTETPIENAKVQLFQDTWDIHEDFLRVTDTNGTLILALNAADMQLICADLLTYPEGVPQNREKENLALAEQLGYAAKTYRREQGMSRELIYEYKTDTDVCLSFSYIGDRLWQVGVYPSEQAMTESEYFLADIQFDYKTPAYPKSFVEAEAPKLGMDQMVPADKIILRLKRLYNALSGYSAIMNSTQMKATFFRDESGAREDCWQITGEGFDVTVSAYSRNVITFKANIPCKDLLNIPYDRMGEEEYEAVARQIGEELFTKLAVYDESGDAHGKAVKSVDVNAVYDYHYCTMDVELEDGTWYECYFADGVLKEIWYYADWGMYGLGQDSGWVADEVYINSAGRLFIPDYRTWDGELHVIHPNESHAE